MSWIAVSPAAPPHLDPRLSLLPLLHLPSPRPCIKNLSGRPFNAVFLHHAGFFRLVYCTLSQKNAVKSGICGGKTSGGSAPCWSIEVLMVVCVCLCCLFGLVCSLFVFFDGLFPRRRKKNFCGSFICLLAC